MKRKIFVLTVFAGISLICLFTCIHAQKPSPHYVFRYAENQAYDYPTTQGGLYFAERVNQRTNGDIQIYVYADEALGDEISILQQVQFGGIDFARVSTSTLVPYSERYVALILPYLYRDDRHLWTVLESDIGESFLGDIDGSGLFGLSWYDAGARHFYTASRRVTCLDELQGLKIRVQESPYMEDMIRALGAEPIALPFSQVYSNLSTGMIDGAENNLPSYESTQHYKVAQNLLLDGHVRVPELQLMSSKTAELLPTEYLQIIQECARESAEYERQLWAERERLANAMILSNGVTVTELSKEERLKFQQACKPLYDKYAGNYRDIVQKIIDTE